MASAHARPMQKRWDDFHVILLVSCGKNKSQNFVMAHQPKEKSAPPQKKKKKNEQRMNENEMQTRLCALKTFPLDAECFRNFLPEMLSKQKGPPVMIRRETYAFDSEKVERYWARSSSSRSDEEGKDLTFVKGGREINCINKMSLYPNPFALLDRERSSSFLRVTRDENLLCLKRKIRNCSRSSAL